MANEFRPGHPVLFWTFIVVLIFVFFSLAKAMATIDNCDDRATGAKHWVIWTPRWECGGSGIKLTE